jgi:hypothetical protein
MRAKGLISETTGYSIIIVKNAPMAGSSPTRTPIKGANKIKSISSMIVLIVLGDPEQ